MNNPKHATVAITLPCGIQVNSDSLFLKTPEATYTYADLLCASNELYRRTEHIPPRMPVAIRTENTADCALTIAACWIINRPIIPVPTSLGDNDLYVVLQRVNTKYMFHSNPTSELTGASCIFTGKLVTTSNDPIERTTPVPISAISDDDLFGIFQTSGTTALPKLVPILRRQIRVAASSAATNFRLQPGELWYHALPLHHIGGISVITRALHWGSGIYLDQRFDPAHFADLLRQNEMHAASLVPTQLRRLLQTHPTTPGTSFKAVLLGGGPIPADIMQSSQELRLPVVGSFGMTETAAQCIATPLSDWSTWPPDSCGLPLPGIQAEIRPIPDWNEHNTGLLWVKGEQVFGGYFEGFHPNYTMKALIRDDFDAEGWFCTGDFAKKDDLGRIRIEMRRTDRIVTGGENVNPNEVEQALASLHLFDDLAITGIPDPEWGQIVALFAVPKPDKSILSNISATVEIDEQALLQQVRTLLKPILPGYKLPRKVVLLNQIPRTHSGKIMRHKLTAPD